MTSFKEFFLTENIDSKLSILLKQFGGQLQKRYESSYGSVTPEMLPNLVKREVLEMDPTPGSDFATWIIRMRINKSIREMKTLRRLKNV